ncbi:MAG TPA: sodium ion-translocating decarboxylase subunit beta, partial [Prolixibacteraceae bacterium]|nr:sodium ion-translocating decarboxylase subunit beta [Prolixibacteraceae bacterium]
MDVLQKLYEMTAFGSLIENPGSLLMLAIGSILLYLGIRKQYEPLLLVPIAFGVILANLPGGGMGVVPGEFIQLEGLKQAASPDMNLMELEMEHRYMNLFEIAHEYGIMNFLYYMLIKTGLLPPIIFMGVGALTDFGPMLRNLRLSFFGAA